MGKYEDSLEIYRDVEKLRLLQLNHCYPDINNEKRDRASCLCKVAEKSLINTFHESHPDVLLTRYEIGYCLFDLRRNDEALICLLETEKKQLEVLGEKHPSLLKTQKLISDVQSNLKKKCYLM